MKVRVLWLPTLVMFALAFLQTSSHDMSTVALAEKNGTIVKPYTPDIDSAIITGLEPGRTYYATVIVKDEAGNKSVYKTVEFTTPAVTDQPPTAPPVVIIVKPAPNQIVSGRYTIEARASDDSGGVASLALYINGVVAASACACATRTYSWNTNPYKGRIVRIQAIAKDVDGQETTATTLVQVRR
jgi:hypothetical protein